MIRDMLTSIKEMKPEVFKILKDGITIDDSISIRTTSFGIRKLLDLMMTRMGSTSSCTAGPYA
jgi:hypothetical protein